MSPPLVDRSVIILSTCDATLLPGLGTTKDECGLKKYKRAGRFQTNAGLTWNKVRRSDWKWRTSRELRWGHSDGDNGVFHLVFISVMQTECRRWWRSCRVETGRWSVCSLLARTDKVQGSGESCCCCQFIYLRGDKAAQPQSAAVAQFSPFRKSKLAFCVGNNYVSQSFLRKEEKYGGCFHILNVCRGGGNGLPTEIYEVMSTLTFLCVCSPITSHMLLKRSVITSHSEDIFIWLMSRGYH